MSRLPANQVGESQWSSLEMPMQPDAKVMKPNLGSQTRLKTCQGVRAFTGKSKRIEQFVINRLDQLAQTSQPTTPLLGPLRLALLMRRCNDLRSEQLTPTRVWLV